MDDSVTYYSNEIPTNFVKTSRKGGIFDANYFDRVDTAHVGNARFKVQLPGPLNSKYGRTAHKKRRKFNHLSDSLN